jgi:hypothetical protein
MNNASMSITIQVLCRHMFSFLLGRNLGAELLDYMVTLYLTFRLFSHGKLLQFLIYKWIQD